MCGDIILRIFQGQPPTIEEQYLAACKNNDDAVFNLLNTCDIGLTTLVEGFFLAIENNSHLLLIDYLFKFISQEISHWQITPLAYACKYGNHFSIDYFMEKCKDIHENNDQALLYSLHNIQTDVAAAIIARGNPAHIYNNDILHEIIDHGHKEIAATLIEKNEIYLNKFKEIVPNVERRFINCGTIDYIESY